MRLRTIKLTSVDKSLAIRIKEKAVSQESVLINVSFISNSKIWLKNNQKWHLIGTRYDIRRSQDVKLFQARKMRPLAIMHPLKKMQYIRLVFYHIDVPSFNETAVKVSRVNAKQQHKCVCKFLSTCDAWFEYLKCLVTLLEYAD